MSYDLSEYLPICFLFQGYWVGKSFSDMHGSRKMTIVFHSLIDNNPDKSLSNCKHVRMNSRWASSSLLAVLVLGEAVPLNLRYMLFGAR